jgi:hypothetical protein
MEPSCIAGGDLALNAKTSATATELGMGTISSVPSSQASQNEVSEDEGLKQPLLILYVSSMT